MESFLSIHSVCISVIYSIPFLSPCPSFVINFFPYTPNCPLLPSLYFFPVFSSYSFFVLCTFPCLFSVHTHFFVFPSLSLARMYITVNIWVFERKNYHTSKPNKNRTNFNYAQANQKVCKLCQHNCVRAGRAKRKQLDKSINKSAQRRPVLVI